MRIWCALVLLAVGCSAQENIRSIAGAVIDSSGVGIPLTTVTLSGATTGVVLSDDQGKFAFSMLEPGAYKLKFQGSGFREHSLDVIMNQRPVLLGNVVLRVFIGDDLAVPEIPTSLMVSGTGSMYGIVRYHLAGVAKAVVSLRLSGESASVKITRTDAAGNFQLDDVHAGLYDLTIEADGFKRANVDSIGLQRGRVVILPPVYMLRPPTQIR